MDLDVKMKAVMLGAVFLIVSSFPFILCILYYLTASAWFGETK